MARLAFMVLENINLPFMHVEWRAVQKFMATGNWKINKLVFLKKKRIQGHYDEHGPDTSYFWPNSVEVTH